MSFCLKAAILQQTAEYIYQLEQEKTRLLSQNSQLKRLYSLSQQGLSSPNADETDSPRLKKKRPNLESTSELLKSEESEPTSVADISLQLLNEQRLRMRLEERLKTLEQQLQQASKPTAVTQTTVTLPTQPLKMEVVQPATEATVTASIQDKKPLPQPPPTTQILLADKNGIRVEKVEKKVEVVTTPAPAVAPTAVQVAPVTVQPKVEELKSAAPSNGKRSFIVSTSAPTPNAPSAVPSGSNPAANRHNLDSIVEAIRHLEGDHCFSEPLQGSVTVTKNLVPSKNLVLPPPPGPGATPIPATLLPKQPLAQSKENSSIIIVKQCQT